MFYFIKIYSTSNISTLQITLRTDLTTEQRCLSSRMARLLVICYVTTALTANNYNLCFLAL